MKRINKYISHLASALLRTLSQASVPAALALALLLTPAFTSCHKVEIDPELDGKYAIAFDEVTTKAQVTSSNIATNGNAFSVYGYYTTDENGYNASSTFNAFNTNPKVVTYSSSTTPNWTYPEDQVEYWQDGAAYNFMAYFPAEFPANISSTYPSASFTGYQITSLRSRQIDILAARAQKRTSDIFDNNGVANNTVVSFDFQHLLTNISIKLSVEEGMEAIVNTVILNNVAQKADCSLVSNQYVWTNHSGSTLIGDNTKTTRLVNDLDDPDDPNDVFEYEEVQDYFEEGILAIPQKLTANNRVQLIVIANATNLATGDVFENQRFENIIPISGEGVPTEWLPGKKYTYAATLSIDHSISFGVPSVELWKEGDDMSGTVVIM